MKVVQKCGRRIAGIAAWKLHSITEGCRKKKEKNMISNQILQNTIDGLKGIARTDLCVIDTEGKVLASTFPDGENYMESALLFVE